MSEWQIQEGRLLYLAMHQRDSLKKVQELMNKQLWFQHSEYYEEAGRRIVSFYASMTQSDSRSASQLTNTGFVIIQGRKIDIAEYQTKHLQKRE